ncbi:hypothetical protein tloyanaT_17860 [Thalassotalea loyana]|uniref:PDZ domain-containing protein n=1 Tax=Thalassotalea loyana TaxID=280483 RepID=A0ABQ6HDL9_9GAMM|nr:aspartyl protease family protein [Thalassotalea loyana]GLX85534.1 hypothetical protein tloyanaT_17860 [Thalassotalea loyana]
MNCVKQYVNKLMILGFGMLLSGCQVWQLASYQWNNANAVATWPTDGKGQGITREVIPFKQLNNHILVDVSVNESESLTFVVDTGAAATVITETDRTDKLMLSLDNPMTISGAGDDDDPVAYLVHNNRVQVGRFTIDNLSVVYAPTEALPFDSRKETYFDGVLGADFFNCCIVEINHDEQVIYFQPRTDEVIANYVQPNWQPLDMQVIGNTPFLHTQVTDSKANKPVKLLVDTGSTGTVTLFSTTGKFEVPEQHYASRSSGISGDSQNLVGILKGINFGDLQVHDFPSYFRVTGSNPQSGSDGVLGNQLLKRFNQVYDFQGQKLYLQQLKQADLPILADRSGLRVLPHAHGAIVKDVSPESYAERIELTVGDVITKINGKVVDVASHDELTGYFNEPNQKTLSLCWLQNQVEQCGELALYDRI